MFLNDCKTDAALPVQLIKINPKQRPGWAKPNRASTLAPAPSPKPMTYFTCKKSKTVTKSSPKVFNDGNWKLKFDVIYYLYITENYNNVICIIRDAESVLPYCIYYHHIRSCSYFYQIFGRLIRVF